MKIMNTTPKLTTVKLLLGVLIATCAFTAAANAQSSFEGKFTLPYAAHWNGAVLPAGEYTIQVVAKGKPAVLRSTSNDTAAFTSTPAIGDREKGAARLTVTILGHERRIRSVNVPQLGASLIFEPLTKMEREMLAKEGHIDSVPVVTARK
jgi:hypothetical protein